MNLSPAINAIYRFSAFSCEEKVISHFVRGYKIEADMLAKDKKINRSLLEVVSKPSIAFKVKAERGGQPQEYT